MATQIVRYVEFYFPDPLQPIKIFQVASRDIKTLQIPPDAYAFRYFYRQISTENEISMVSKRLWTTPMCFVNAQYKTTKEVLEVAGSDLKAQIEKEKWERAVLCNDGEFRQSKHGDAIRYTKKFKKTLE